MAIESVVDVTDEPGVKNDGVNVAFDAAGNPEAENEMALAKPPGPGVKVMVKLAVCPAVTVTEGVEVPSVESWVMVVGSVAVSFVRLTSPPPETVAAFVTLSAEFAATLTVTVTTG